MSSLKELIGKQLGRYAIVDHLATGGMAEIFLARHNAESGFSKELVLKVLQPRWEDHPEVVDLFMGEARIAALLNHPNIVDIYDVASEEGTHYIAMEHIAGRTLTELAKRAIEVSKEIPLDFGVFLAAEVAAALAYMYDGIGNDGQPFRVVHRDISPTNVLVGTAGDVKLIDFGIARQGAVIVEESGARPGKVTYMSPEQVKGEPIDGRSDIFCLGTILYEITLGKRLWRGPREVAVKRIVEERPKPPTFVRRDYPPELEKIVLRALEKRPEDRFQSPSDFHRALQGFLVEAGLRLRNKYQMALYVEGIFSEAAEAMVSEATIKKARAFTDGDESADADYEPLDFDRPSEEGPGAALARAMRSGSIRLEKPLSREIQVAAAPVAVAPQNNPVVAHSDVVSPSLGAAAAELGRDASPPNGESITVLPPAASKGQTKSITKQAASSSGSDPAPASVKKPVSSDIKVPRTSTDEGEVHLPKRRAGAIIFTILLLLTAGAAVWFLR